MIKEYKTGDYLNDGSIEERSLCLALIRQVMSGNKPDVKCLRNHTNPAFPIKENRGFNYRDYPQDNWELGTKIAGNIPAWSCLNLKPEILEEAIKNCLSQYTLQFFKANVESNINYWFIFSKTEKCDFWNEVARTLRGLYSETVKDTNIEQSYKIKENETELQRKKTSAARGDLPEGIVAGSGKSKAAIVSGHLCYNICSRGQEA